VTSMVHWLSLVVFRAVQELEEEQRMIDEQVSKGAFQSVERDKALEVGGVRAGVPCDGHRCERAERVVQKNSRQGGLKGPKNSRQGGGVVRHCWGHPDGQLGRGCLERRDGCMKGVRAGRAVA
jgi:hypothetical protein